MSIAAQGVVGPAAARTPRQHAPAIPESVMRQLRSHFASWRLEYICRVLSVEELGVIRDLRDALILARIKRMSPRRLRRFDCFVPLDARQQRDYEHAQLDWIRDEEHLLTQRLGRTPTHQELFADFMRNQNGLRFRAYYTMKHPARMRCRQSA